MPLSEDDQTNIALAVLYPLATVLVALRVWVKWRKLRSFGLDDASIILSWVFFTVYGIALVIESTVPDHSGIENAQKSVTLTTISNVFYCITSIFLKAAIGLFFLRIVLDRKGRNFIWAVVAISTINNTFQALFITFLCGNPVHFFANALQNKCLDTSSVMAAWYAQAAVNSSVDFAFVLLPVHILRNTTKSRQTRGAIGIVLLLGTAGSIFSVVRIPFISRIEKNSGGDSLEAIDLWTTLELGTGIIAACLPTLSSLSKAIGQNVKKWTVGSRIAWRQPNGRWRWQQPASDRQELTVETYLTKHEIV